MKESLIKFYVLKDEEDVKDLVVDLHHLGGEDIEILERDFDVDLGLTDETVPDGEWPWGFDDFAKEHIRSVGPSWKMPCICYVCYERAFDRLGPVTMKFFDWESLDKLGLELKK